MVGVAVAPKEVGRKSAVSTVVDGHEPMLMLLVRGKDSESGLTVEDDVAEINDTVLGSFARARFGIVVESDFSCLLPLSRLGSRRRPLPRR